MRSASYLSPNEQRSPRSRQAVSLLLTLVAHALLLLLLLKLAPPLTSRPADDHGLLTFDVAPETQKAPRPRTVAKARRANPPRPKPPAVPPPLVTPPKPLLIPGLEHFDIRQVHSTLTEEELARAEGKAGRGESSASAYGPGEGPGGVRLFNAEWYREPTDAELSYYLPERRVTGWGMIACQTVERYHVDNCRSLGDDPPGSGLSQAIRKAAWQFLVRPPRIDGKPLIGSWVRIRIEFTERGAEVANGPKR